MLLFKFLREAKIENVKNHRPLQMPSVTAPNLKNHATYRNLPKVGNQPTFSS